MNNLLDVIAHYDEMLPEEQTALQEAIASNPELARLFIRWRRFQHDVADSMNEAIPDRERLVLHALLLQNADLLTSEERESAEADEDRIKAAVARHPGFQDIVKDIQLAGEDFGLLWSRHEKMARPFNSSHKTAPYSPGQTRILPLFRIAAALLILVSISAVVFLMVRNQRVETVKTRPGELRIIELVDGSMVRLYEKSKITYRKAGFTEAFDRSIYLSGRAFFDVTPTSEPFTVETQTARTTAIGTRFSIDANRSFTEVVLTNGQVSVDSKRRSGHTVTLAPGQYSRIERRLPPSEPEQVQNLTDKLSWTGLAVFRETPLEDIVAYFSRHFEQTLTVSSELASEPFNATFDPDTLSVAELMNTLAIAFDATYDSTTTEGHILHN